MPACPKAMACSERTRWVLGELSGRKEKKRKARKEYPGTFREREGDRGLRERKNGRVMAGF